MSRQQKRDLADRHDNQQHQIEEQFHAYSSFYFLHFIVMAQKNVFFEKKKHNIIWSLLHATLSDNDNYVCNSTLFHNFEYNIEPETKTKSVLSIFGMTWFESTNNSLVLPWMSTRSSWWQIIDYFFVKNVWNWWNISHVNVSD